DQNRFTRTCLQLLNLPCKVPDGLSPFVIRQTAQMAHLSGNGLFLLVQSGTRLSLQNNKRGQQNGSLEEVHTFHGTATPNCLGAERLAPFPRNKGPIYGMRNVRADIQFSGYVDIPR